MRVLLDPCHLFLKVRHSKIVLSKLLIFEVKLLGFSILFSRTVPTDSWQSKWLVVFGEGCLINSILQRSEAVGEGRICGLETTKVS